MLGFARKMDNGKTKPQWEFSEKAIQVLEAYLQKYPAIVEAIEANPEAKEFNLHDLNLETIIEEDLPPVHSIKPDEKIGMLEENEIDNDNDQPQDDDEEDTPAPQHSHQKNPQEQYIKHAKEWIRSLKISTQGRLVLCGSEALATAGIKE